MGKRSSKDIIFSLTMPKAEVPFAVLSTRLSRFRKMRQDFESLGLRVEVIDLG